MAVKQGDVEIVPRRSNIEGAWWFLAGIGCSVVWGVAIINYTGIVVCR